MSAIWISSTETKGGMLIGFFATKGKVRMPKNITTKWKVEDINSPLYIIIFLYYLSLEGSEIKATFEKPEPDNIPIISRTLP